MTLKELRAQSGKTCAEVAERLAVTTQAVRHYENGIRSIGLKEIIKLSQLYDVSEREIIDAQIKSIDVRKSE